MCNGEQNCCLRWLIRKQHSDYKRAKINVAGNAEPITVALYVVVISLNGLPKLLLHNETILSGQTEETNVDGRSSGVGGVKASLVGV